MYLVGLPCFTLFPFGALALELPILLPIEEQAAQTRAMGSVDNDGPQQRDLLFHIHIPGPNRRPRLVRSA